jgi:hypothetical protein
VASDEVARLHDALLRLRWLSGACRLSIAKTSGGTARFIVRCDMTVSMVKHPTMMARRFSVSRDPVTCVIAAYRDVVAAGRSSARATLVGKRASDMGRFIALAARPAGSPSTADGDGRFIGGVDGYRVMRGRVARHRA